MERVTRGWPLVLQMSSDLPAPPEIVWALITDWERQGDWMLEARDFEVVGEQRTGVGVVARARVSIAGITITDQIEVTDWEPHRHLGIRHHGWVTGRGDVRLAPVGLSRSFIRWREELHPPLGLLGALGLTLLKPLMRRIFERDVRVLGELARRRATG